MTEAEIQRRKERIEKSKKLKTTSSISTSTDLSQDEIRRRQERVAATQGSAKTQLSDMYSSQASAPKTETPNFSSFSQRRRGNIDSRSAEAQRIQENYYKKGVTTPEAQEYVTHLRYNKLGKNEYDLLDNIVNTQEEKDAVTTNYLVQALRGVDSYDAQYRSPDVVNTSKADEARKKFKEMGYSDDEITKLVRYHQSQRNAENAKIVSEDIKQMAEEHPILASGVSVVSNIGTPAGLVEVARAKATDTPIDPNSQWFGASRMTSDIRGEVQENYDWNIDLNKDGKSWDAIDFAYGAGMSAVDSMVASKLMPGLGITTKSGNFVVKALTKTANGMLGGSLIGAQAMTSTMQDVAKRGGTTDQAIGAGVVSFLAETLSEAWSIGNYKGLKESGKQGLRNLAIDLLKSAGVNASEEAITEAVNLVYDRYALGEASNFELNTQAYMQTQKEDGTYYTREEAENLAWQDSLKQVREAALSGAFQAVIMGGDAVTSRAVQHSYNKALGKKIKESGNAAEVIKEARQSGDKDVREWVERINKTDTTTSEVNVKDSDLGGVAFEMAKKRENTEEELMRYLAQKPSGTLSASEKVAITNPTLGRKDGKVISLSSVEAVKNGNITVKNSNGEMQKLDIKKLDGKAKAIWSYASEHFTDAKAIEGFVKGYNGGNIDIYSRVYKGVFDLASTGMTGEKIKEERMFNLNAISEQAFNYAVEAGNVAMSYKEGVVDLTTAKKSKSQKFTMKMADEFGKRHGMNITFVDTLGTREGFLTPGKNQIVIALDSSKGAIVRTLGHETFHYVKKNAGTQAEQISNFVVETMTRLKGAEWVENQYKMYEEQGYKTLEAQKEELVADQMFEVFANERAVNEFVAKDRNFAQKVLDHIKGIIKEIKSIYNQLISTGKYEDMAAWKEDLEALQKVNDMMLDALSNIEQRRKSEQKAEKNTSDEVVNSVSRNPTQIKSATDNIGIFDKDNPDIRFSTKRSVEETKDLIAVHNMQESELLKTLQLGGFPMPSIAIIKAQQGHSEYGPVSVVFNKSTIDPKANKNNKVYGGDAWTPTYPTIEYKINDKVQNKISKLHSELYSKYGADEARPLYNYAYDMERQLNSNRGEAGMIESLKDDERLMQLYLLQSGKGKVEPVIKQTVTELSEADVEMYDYLISAIGKDVVSELKTPPGKNPLQYRTEFYEKNGEKIENAYKQMLRDNFDFTEEQIDNVINNMRKRDFINLIRQTYQYMINGKTTTKEETDSKATSEAIRNAIKDSGFNQWVDELFKGVEEKTGIRNNVDYFTASGNRRSWEALHWENTLENVVKVMKSQDNGVAAFFSGHAIWAVSAKDYKSIDELKADSDRLKSLPKEEYDAIKEGFGMRLNEIATSIMDKSESNQFIAADNAMQCIVEAVRNSKTKSGILNELRQYRQLDVTETAVDDIVSLVSDISNMPTEYFEAKPQRAVELEEIAYVVVPDTSTELVNTLNERGIETRTYTAGDEADRVRALNSDEGILFSTQRDADYMTAVENGDMETAQRMVDEAAKSAGYTVKGLHSTNAEFTVFDVSKTSSYNFHGKGIYFTNSLKDLENNYENYEGPDPWQKIDDRALELLYDKHGLSYDDTLTGDPEIINLLNECYEEAISEFNQTQRRITAYLKFDNPYIFNKGDDINVDVDRTVYDGIIDNQVFENIGHSGMNEETVHYVVFNPRNIKSADPVTYDDDGNIVPLSQRFDESNKDIRWATKRWYPDMPKSDLNTIKRMAKNELNKNDNYLDNITKWLYNRKNGKTYFALYSTENESEPTILYASIDDLAAREHNFILDYLIELERESDDRRSKTFNEIFNRLKNSNNLRTVHSVMYGNGRNDNGDVSVHSGQSRGGISRALRNCLQDSYERRNSVEDNQYSTKREYSVSEEASDSILNTKEYQEIIDIVNQRYNLTNKKTLSQKAIDRLAGSLLAKAKSKYDKGALTERLSALFDYMANSEELSWEDVMKSAAEISHDILSDSSSLDRSMQMQYKDTLDYLKSLTIYISPELRAEIYSRYGSLENYRRMLGGKTKITVTDSSKVSLDSLWRELNELAPEMFDAETNSLDQAEELMNFFEMTKPQYVNQYEYYWDMNEASYDFALQIYNEYFNIPEIQSESRRHQLEMERLKGKQNAQIAEIRRGYKERMNKIRADRDKKIEALKKENREAYEKLRNEKNAKIEETKELYRQRNQKYRDDRKEIDERRKLRRQIVRTTKNLTNMLVNPTDKKHIPQELIVGINSFAKTMSEHGAFPLQKAISLQKAFKNIGEKAVDPDFNLASMYDEDVEEMLDRLTETLANKELGKMKSNELKEIKDIADYFSHIVSMSNQAFSDNIRENLSELQTSTLNEVSSQDRDKKRMFTKLQTGLLKPVTFFEILESKTLEKLYTNIRKGEEKWARIVYKAKQERISLQKKYGYKEWADDRIEVTTERGDKLSITVKEALSIYATSMREQGVDHIMKGGIVLEEKARKELNEKNLFKKNKDKTVNVKDMNIPLSLADIQYINSKLTAQQKDYADEFVRYMSNDMAKLGNEVSMRLYGILKYTEKNYFPLKSASNFLYTEPAVENDTRIKHMSMTKRTVPKANNPVVIGDFTETVMSHCQDMALYYGFTLPLEDFKRVWNYKTPAFESERPTSIKQQLDMVYGKKANEYIKQMLTDINGGVTKQAGAEVVNKMIGLIKKNSVFASLSVAVQQPSALGRAMAYVSPKYFVGKQPKGTWEEIQKYAPVAIVKEMGYFDTGMGRQAVEWMNETRYEGLKKAFALFYDGNYRDDVLSMLPSFMDEITWGRIWVAVKNETKAKNPELDVNSQEFLEACGERFTYVIDRTQVYDSVFSRSEWMRSKDTGVKVATAFMSEPLTNYNLLYNAAIKAKNGDKKFAARALSAYVVSIVFNSILKSFVTSVRDDDKEKSYWEKYIANVISNITDEPFGMIPYFNDVISLIQGYGSDRMDTQILADSVDALSTIFNSEKSIKEKVKVFVNTLGLAIGVPFKNFNRDAVALYNGAQRILKGDYESTTGKGIKYAVAEKYDSSKFKIYKSPNLGKQVVEAYLEGDTAHYNKQKKNMLEKYGGDVKQVKSQIKSALKEQYQEGKVSKEDARKVMKGTLALSNDEIYWDLDEWDTHLNEGEKYTKYHYWDDAVSSGFNLESVAQKYMNNGVKKEQLSSRITDKYKDEYVSLYNIDPDRAEELMEKLLDAYVAIGYKRSDKKKDIKAWLKQK